jgi:hypothetical protein
VPRAPKLLQYGLVANWNAKTLHQACFWQAVDAVTKKVNNFSYLMRPACAARNVFRAVDQAKHHTN